MSADVEIKAFGQVGEFFLWLFLTAGALICSFGLGGKFWPLFVGLTLIISSFVAYKRTRWHKMQSLAERIRHLKTIPQRSQADPEGLKKEITDLEEILARKYKRKICL